jgi:elongator complex protein 3
VGFSSQTIKTNLAQIVKSEAEAQGIFCQCIRCTELRQEKFNPADIVYETTRVNDHEFFISAEVKTGCGAGRLLLGFIRLRLSAALEQSILPELMGHTAMIRELHVYGSLKAVGADGGSGGGAQHLGIGRTLLAMAEERARAAGFDQMAIISGIGVRGYYQKNRYELRGSYMMKRLAVIVDDEKPEVYEDMVLNVYAILAVLHIIGYLLIRFRRDLFGQSV